MSLVFDKDNVELINYNYMYLDPQNPRFKQKVNSIKNIDKNLIKSKQKEEEDKIKKDTTAYNKLKTSLQTNGYIGMEYFIVVKLSDTFYIVKEGNRRLTAIRDILNNEKAVNMLEIEVKESLENLPCYVLPKDFDMLTLYQVLNARHVVGTTPWGVKERSISVAETYKLLLNKPSLYKGNENTILQELADRSGLTSNISARYFLVAIYLQQTAIEIGQEIINQNQENYISIDELNSLQLDMFTEMSKSKPLLDWFEFSDNKENYLESSLNTTLYEKFVKLILFKIIRSRDQLRPIIRIANKRIYESPIWTEMYNKIIEIYNDSDVQKTDITKIVSRDYTEDFSSRIATSLRQIMNILYDEYIEKDKELDDNSRRLIKEICAMF